MSEPATPDIRLRTGLVVSSDWHGIAWDLEAAAAPNTSPERAFRVVPAPADIFEQALSIQQDLAHHHGMWHRVPISDLLLAATARHHDLGIVHVDADFDRIAEVRSLVARRLQL